MESKREMQRFIDDMKRGRVSRRDFNRALAAVGLTTITMPLLPRSVLAAPDDHPMCFTWATYDTPEMHQEYIDKYGESPRFTLWGDEEEAEAKMIAGFKPDVSMPCSYKVKKWTDAGFLKPIDVSRLSHWDDVIPTLKDVPDTVYDGNRMWVCAWWGLTSVTFRTDLAPEYVDPANHSWGILWDPKYKGRLSMIDSLIDGVMVAAIYSGAKDPFNMTPEEVEKVKKLMQEQLPLLRFYTNSTTTWEQALASGEVIAAASWNSTILNLSKQGLPVAFMNPKEGPMTWTCGISLMSYVSPELEDRAYDLIDAFLSPDTGEHWIMEFGMGHSNKDIYGNLSADDLIQRGLTPDDIEAYIAAGIFQATIQNEPELQAMYEEVKAGM
ncbi:MAG: extracellular solute-binding protein [Gammaproteobacteria bacterium]|nr:extracellular solute-binding protein [Gammaproteobacteria bacterium]